MTPLIQRLPAGKLISISAGRDLRRKPMDPRLVQAAEAEILRRKAQGEWRERRAA